MKKLCRLIDGMFVILILFHGISKAAQGWEANNFDSGTNGRILALASAPEGIYVGGYFTQAGPVSAHGIACWTGSEWIPLGSGVSGGVLAIAATGDGIYAGGYFLQAGGLTVNHIAFWNGSTWSAMDTGTNRPVYSIAAGGGRIIIGGWFTEASGHAVNSIAEWNGSEWVDIGGGLPHLCIWSIAISDGMVYAGGASDFSFPKLVKWDGTAWSGVGGEISGMVESVVVIGSDVYIGGDISQAGGVSVNKIARWNGSTWSALGSGIRGDFWLHDFSVSFEVHTMAYLGGDLYVGGLFNMAGEVGANHIARWDGQNWRALDTGVVAPVEPIDAGVMALAVASSKLYVGGFITEAGGNPVSNIACWNAAGGIPSAYTHMAVTDYAAISDPAEATLGAAWCDFDSDGDPDLFTANDNLKQDALYRNLPGDFDANSYPPLTTETLSSMGGTWGDYNNDGNPDLYISHLGSQGTLIQNNGDDTFTDIPLMTDNMNSFGSAWSDYDLDGDLDLYVTVSGDNNRLYQNNGDGTFTAITTGAPVTDGGSSRNAAWCDIDLDGDPDLYVTNTSDEANYFYLNNGDGTFVKVTTGELVTDTGESWSASWGDYNNDGDPDLFVGNNGQPNCLYRNNGDKTFTKVLSGLVVTDNDHSRSSAWGDFDNDGDLDLFVSNRNDDSKLYMNKGMGNFDRYILASGNFRGTALADMDLDGDLDLFICQDGGPNRLFENTINEGNHWLEVECRGTETNRSAIGAKVSVQAVVKGQLIWQTQEISAQTGFGGQSEMIAHFGLGEAGTVGQLRIQWPGGSLWDTTDVVADQRLVIVEKTSQEPPVNHPPVALNDTLVIQQDSILIVYPLENDSDPENDPLTIQEVGGAGTSGSMAVDPGDTTLTFTPAAGFAGEAVFEYVISDGKGGLDTAEVHITVEEGMLVREAGSVPCSFALFQNQPNPFNPVTRIRVDLPKSCEVSLAVYDVLGREIIRLMTGEQVAGRYRIHWNGRDRYGKQVTSGVYFYRIEAGEFKQVRKMLLVR
jgi:hypothetical protein